MEWKNFLWGLWNGLTAWVVLIVHLFGGWRQYPLYDPKRSGGWYDFGFLLGASSSLLGSSGPGRARGLTKSKGQVSSKPVAQPKKSQVNQSVANDSGHNEV